jgi:hypothetical protein
MNAAMAVAAAVNLISPVMGISLAVMPTTSNLATRFAGKSQGIPSPPSTRREPSCLLPRFASSTGEQHPNETVRQPKRNREATLNESERSYRTVTS